MSLVELILSRKEVLFSLALVLLVLIIALLLAIGPTLRRKWKRTMMQRKANRAAKLARLRKQQSLNRRRQQMNRQEPAEGVAEVQPVEPVEPVEPITVEALPEGTVPPEEDPGDVGGEALSPEEAAAAALQGIFDGEFIDDEADQRYKILLKGIEPITAEQLADLANSVEDKLLAHQPKRDNS